MSEVEPSLSATLTLTMRAWARPGALPGVVAAATMPARCVPWPKASRLRSSSTSASTERSGPLTTRPASEPTGETPESTRATSVRPPEASSAPIVPRRLSSVVLTVAGTIVGGAAQVVGAVPVDRLDPAGAAQRAHRAARDPGGEPMDQRDLTHDMPPQVPHGLLWAVAGSRLLEHHDQRAALVSAGRRRRQGDEEGERPEDREGDPPANGVCRTVGHMRVFGAERGSAKALKASPGALGRLWQLWREGREVRAESPAAPQVPARGLGSRPALPMTKMCSTP